MKKERISFKEESYMPILIKTIKTIIDLRVFIINNINNGTPALKHAVAPYIKNVSERVDRILKQFHIHLSHRLSCKIRLKLCNFKDNREPPNQAGVVYKMSCNDCNALYIGETDRLLKERTEEHRKRFG